MRDGLAPLGRLVTLVSADAGRVVFFRFQWVWDVGFWFFAQFPPSRALTQWGMTRLGGDGLERLIQTVAPDAVVSTYPNTMEVLARLRRSGRIDVPVCSAITDLAGMHYWAPAGCDAYLITHPESEAEVRRVAGKDANIACVHGLTRPEFLEPRSHSAARDGLGLPIGASVVLVSGGGWGVGDAAGAVEQALASAPVDLVVCLCGRNETVRRALAQRFASEPRVQVHGFTNTMRDWLAAADVLVHSTGGLTVLEALTQGCPVISYGWGRGHLRVNDAAFRRFGLADVVRDRQDLRAAIERALARPRPAPIPYADRPSAASVVLGLVR